MARLSRFWLCTFSALILSSFAFSSVTLSYPAYHVPGSGVALDVSRTSPEHTTISLRAPDVRISTHAAGYENFHEFTLSGEPLIPAEGSPALPLVHRFYRIPNTGGVDLHILEADYDVIENVNPLPYSSESGLAVARDEAVYSADAWYPANVAEMSAPMILRDFRMVGVALYPVQVNPVTHQARVYRNISVEVVANNQPGENEITRVRRPSGAWAPIYRSLLGNLDDGALDDMTTTPGSLLILCKPDPANVDPFVDSLLLWKTRKGFKVTVDSRSNWSVTSMTTAIHNAYANSDPPLEYVCLIGDPAASFGVPSGSSGDYGGDFDHIFGLAAQGSTSDIECVGVGRLCGNTSAQMAVINAKIMTYEREPHLVNAQGQADTMWFHRSLLYADTGINCAGNYMLMQWGADQFARYTGVDSNEVIGANSINATIIGQRFGRGLSFFVWRGSGGEAQAGLAGSCNSGYRLPITITVTCTAGNFVQTDGMSEQFLTQGSTTNLKGGICGIGSATIATHNPENITFVGGFLYSVINLNVEHLGDAVASGKAQLYSAFGDWNSMAFYFSRYNNLLGDPSLSIWTHVPTELNVTHPTALNVGARRVEVVVHRQGDDAPVADAVVCLWKRGADSTWVVGNTDADGRIVFPVSINTAGDLLVTVTKQNHKPYLGTIPCNVVDCMPMLSSYTLDDDNNGGTQGNNNGILNPGETIDLPVYVRNFGSTGTATNISATLTSNDSHVAIVNGTSTYANLAPGDSVLGAQPFRIQVAATMPHHEVAQLTLSISSSSGETSGVIPLSCVSADLRFVRHDSAGATFGPGQTRNLTVTLQNTGATAITGVQGHLQSLSPFVTIDTEVSTYGTIAAGAQASNHADPFVVSANPMTFRGHQASMLLVLTGDNGFVDSTQFVLPVGSAVFTDPTGPDTYGYYAYDNSDTAYDIHPAFHYEDISQGLGTNLNLNDPGEKTIPSQNFATVRTLPFPVKFYGQTYNQVTVCSNGWIAFGDQHTYDSFRNYAIPAMQAPEALVAVYWDDLRTNGTGQGVWAYYNADSGQYIVQWKASGYGSPAGSLDFEVILYDSTARPSFDGNNHILMQYNHAVMNLNSMYGDEMPGSTIGIQAPGGLIGLPYAYVTSYWPGSAPVQDGRAILFTTDARVMFGQVDGHVYDAATNHPLPGVVVRADRYGFCDTTDAQGHYHLSNVMVGNYHILATKHRFNSDTSASILVVLDSTTTVDFSLHHPEMQLSATSIEDSAHNDPVQTSFDIINNGNGPLDYASQIFLAGDENTTHWDSVGSVNASNLTGDPALWGCEVWNDEWVMSGPAGLDGHPMIYRFSLAGDFLGTIPEPTATVLGWLDLATDGQYLYGSDDHNLVGMDAGGQVRVTIPSPLNPSRAIAYDPYYDHFWVADYTSGIYEIDRQGNPIQHFANDLGLNITGLAWNANDLNGYKLYVFSRNGTNGLTRVTKMEPFGNHQRMTAADLAGIPGDQAAGCTVTTLWNSTLSTFAGIIRNTDGGARLGIYEVSFNTSWITLSPASGTVPGGTRQTVTVSLDPNILRNARYQVIAHLTSAAYDTLMRLPITFVVQHDVPANPRESGKIPTEYALRQNYPNPFNPTTQIVFDLPKAGHVQLRIFNALGQLVETPVDETRPAGSYAVTWDAHTLATGVYLYQVRAGSYVQTKKMLLMK